MPEETNPTPPEMQNQPEGVAAPATTPEVAPTEAPPAPTQQPVVASKKSFPVLAVVILILAVVLAGIAAGYYFLSMQNTQPAAPEMMVSETPTPVPPSPTPAGVSDSMDSATIENEIENANPDPIDPDLEQLNNYTDQL